MKKTFLLLGVIGLLSAGNTFASISTITLSQNNLTGGNGGGAFTAVTSGNGTFATFCIDPSHNFTPGIKYDYTISQNTTDPNGQNINYISIGTAFLYSSFLDIMNNNPTSWTASQSTLLQETLWALEGEIKNISSILNSGNMFYNELIAQFNQGGTLSASKALAAAEANAGANNIYGVAVMNLYDPKTGALAQSQLVRCYTPPVVSVPEPSTIVAGALLLLPLGISALKVLRRKQATTS